MNDSQSSEKPDGLGLPMALIFHAVYFALRSLGYHTFSKWGRTGSATRPQAVYIVRNPDGRYVSGLSRYWNNSALARALPLASMPPTTSTFPLASNVAVWPARAVDMLPVVAKSPLAGS